MRVDYDSLAPFEKDTQWLLNKLPGLKQDDVEKFCFKVAYLTEEKNWGWSRARNAAYIEYFG